MEAVLTILGSVGRLNHAGGASKEGRCNVKTRCEGSRTFPENIHGAWRFHLHLRAHADAAARGSAAQLNMRTDKKSMHTIHIQRYVSTQWTNPSLNTIALAENVPTCMQMNSP